MVSRRQHRRENLDSSAVSLSSGDRVKRRRVEFTEQSAGKECTTQRVIQRPVKGPVGSPAQGYVEATPG